MHLASMAVITKTWLLSVRLNHLSEENGLQNPKHFWQVKWIKTPWVIKHLIEGKMDFKNPKHFYKEMDN